MSTVTLNETEFTVCYIDPAAPSEGRIIDGTTPDTAYVNFPASFVEKTLYLIRRTDETHYAQLEGSWTNDEILNIAFFGMPKSTDEFYDMMPAEAKTAWGSDAAEYGNIAVENITLNYGVCLNNLVKLTASRIYFFRTEAAKKAFNYNFGPMFFSTNATSNMSFSYCKFGYKGFNINDRKYLESLESLSFTVDSAYAGNYVKTSGSLEIGNSIINSFFWSGDETEYFSNNYRNYRVHGFSAQKEIRLYDSNIYYAPHPRCNSDGFDSSLLYNKGDIYLKNTHQYLVPNNASEWNNLLINNDCSTNCSKLFIRDFALSKMNFTGKDDYSNSTRYNSGCIIKASTRYVDVNNITIDWENENTFKICSPLITISCCSSSDLKNHCIKNITIKNVQNENNDSPLLHIDGYELPDYSKRNDTDVYNKLSNFYSALKIDGIEIDTKHNGCQLAYFNGCNVVGGNFKYGHVTLGDRCYFKCSKLYSDKNKTGIITSGFGNYINIDELTVDADENLPASTCAYTNSYGYWLGHNKVIINKVNIKPFELATASDHCYSDRFTQWVALDYNGKFVERNDTTLAQSWSAKRVGSTSNSSIKVYTTADVDELNWLNLGGEINNGFEVSAQSTGDHYVEAYFAYYNDMQKKTNIDMKIVADVLVPKEVDGKIVYDIYPSTLYGKIVDDDSEWVGDSSVVSKKFRIKIPVTTLAKAIQVKLKYGWSDPVGYVYFDPDIKLVKIL